MLRRPIALLIGALIMILDHAGCSSSTSTSGPPSSGSVQTDARYLDHEIDEPLLEYLLDSSTSMPQTIAPSGKHQIQWLSDTSQSLATYALSFVSSDPAKHIPYVWGGKQIVQPTEWSSPPNENKTACTARVGLDCSGFVGLVLEHFGVRPDVPEVSVSGLVNELNWQKVKSKGYDVIYFGNPEYKNLLPGDILIFTDAIGNLVHTGIFYSQEAQFPSGKQPGFINSVGHSHCTEDYSTEAGGKLTGVVISPLGPITHPRLLLAIRIALKPYLKFTVDGNDFINHSQTSVSPFLYDTVTRQFEAYADDDSSSTAKLALVHIVADGVTGKGTYAIPERDHDSTRYSELYLIPNDSEYNGDSILYYATTPPKWWHGSDAPTTGGELKLTSFARDNAYGSVAGSFTLRANAYWSRVEDTTYFVDTVKVTKTVTRYYVAQKKVTGSFEGLMGLE